MPDTSLYELFRLHKLDARLLEIKNRAGALDAGKAILKEIARIKEEEKAVREEPARLQTVIKDLELRAGTNRDKAKSLDKELYSGKVVNPKEVATMEGEIARLKALADQEETESLEMMELIPAAEEAAKKVNVGLARLAKQYEAKKQSDTAEMGALQDEYKRLVPIRAEQAKNVPRLLLEQYERIRAKLGGVGMGEVVNGVCDACGTIVPTKTQQALGEDKVLTCEDCHRILFMAVGPE